MLLLNDQKKEKVPLTLGTIAKRAPTGTSRTNRQKRFGVLRSVFLVFEFKKCVLDQ